MKYRQTKVYHDGSHYVGIQRTPRERRYRPREKEEVFFFDGEPAEEEREKTETTLFETEPKEVEKPEDLPVQKGVTKSGEFNRLYDESRQMRRWERKQYILKNIRPLFKSDQEAASYVDKKLRDKKRALAERRLRFRRKAYMNDFNCVATFTYADGKHTEESFRKTFMNCLHRLRTRRGWKYMGVWERAPKTGRLHFHGFVYVPEGGMPGELFKKQDYNLNTHRMQTTIQNTYFNERFGRCDFESVVRVPMMYDRAVGYILKYIEKTGERLVYSRGTPMYLITDVEEKDVLTRMGEENGKLLLVDNFECWDGDKYLGRVNEGGKERAKKGN